MGIFPTYISIARELFPFYVPDGRENFFCLYITYRGEMNMFAKKWMAVVVGAAPTAGVVVSDAAPPAVSIVVAREASEGPRGSDNDRPGDRHHRGGRMHIELPAAIVIMRETTEGPRA
jgi:hypothetical protein